jgi:hypothetical protein
LFTFGVLVAVTILMKERWAGLGPLWVARFPLLQDRACA